MAEGNQNLSLDHLNPKFAVNQAKEEAMMLRYTSTITRELLFAIDLMEYAMSLRNLQLPDCAYPNCCRRDGRPTLTDFNDLLKRFVELFMPFLPKLGKYPLMDQMDRVNYDTFKKLINVSGIVIKRLVRSGRTRSGTRAFWVFCLETVEMSIRAYQHGMRNAPHFGIMIICRTHMQFDRMDAFDAEHPWHSMYNMAYDVVQWLEPKTHGRSS